MNTISLPLLFALSFMPAALSAAETAPDQWVPARWQGGPLELRRRAMEQKPAADAATAQVIRDWYQPATLDLLKDTPINCLLVTWSAGAGDDEEREQRRLVAAYVKAAHGRGIAVLGIVYRTGDRADLVRAAREAGLDGLVLEGNLSTAQALADTAPFPVIPLPAQSARAGAGNWPVAGTAAGVTPRINPLSESGAATATPTSEPWIDSNIWLVRSLRVGGGKLVWLGYSLRDPAASDYLRAVADAAAAGGRWVLNLDDRFRVDLWRKQPRAVALWRQISAYLRFTEEHAEWRRFAPAGPLGIVQDPSARDADLSGEYVNLVTRRRVPYRIIERPALGSGVLADLRAVLAVDLSPPTPGERGLLEAFAEKGGLLVGGPRWGPAVPQDKEFVVRNHGQGRIVVYRDDPPDPEAVSKQLPILLGRDNLGVRLFNVLSVLCHVARDDSGGRLAVHLINYASTPSEAVTVRVDGGYSKARLYSPDGATSLEIEKPSPGRIEVRIESLPVYGVLILEQ